MEKDESFMRILLIICAVFYGSLIFGQKAKQEKLLDFPFNPSEASTTIDVKFYHIDVAVALDSSYLKGSVICKFLTKEKLQKVRFDLHDDWKVSGIQGADTFFHKNHTLELLLHNEIPADSLATVRIFYEGVPPVQEKGGREYGLLYGTHGKDEEVFPVIASVAYPEHARLWFPCRDVANDRADSIYVDIQVRDTVKQVTQVDRRRKKESTSKYPVIALSNGDLSGKSRRSGMQIFRWRHRYPIAPHQVALAVSNYELNKEEYTSPYNEKFTLEFYTYPEHTRRAMATIRRSSEIMTCLSNTFGEYPFNREKFGLIQVSMNLGLNGAPMQSSPFLPDLNSRKMPRIVHEMGHMWFGASLTYPDHEDAWIPEAFASFAEGVWQEYRRGPYAYFRTLSSKEYFGPGTLYTKNPEDASIELYSNRGMHVLHMLRGVMGDYYFFQSIQGLLRNPKYRYKKVTTKDLQDICEYYASEDEEQDYSYFFEQWVYGEYFPIYDFSFEAGNRGDLRVDINQEIRDTKPGFFKMPIELRIHFEDGTTLKEKVFNDKPSQSFNFEFENTVTDVEFDPSNWIFKQVLFKRQITNDRRAVSKPRIQLSDNHRQIAFLFESDSRQNVLMELLDKDKKVVFSREEKGLDGKVAKEISISDEEAVSGPYELRITTKGEIITRPVRLTR